MFMSLDLVVTFILLIKLDEISIGYDHKSNKREIQLEEIVE